MFNVIETDDSIFKVGLAVFCFMFPLLTPEKPPTEIGKLLVDIVSSAGRLYRMQ